MEELLIYIFFRLPGAFILWVFTGFKYKIGNVVEQKSENTREIIISSAIWILIVLTFYILNN